jgi:hypothetical protein
MTITLYIGNPNHVPANTVILNDNQHPESLLRDVRDALSTGLNAFKTNQPVVLGYFTCLLEWSRHTSVTNRKYPVNIKNLFVYEYSANGFESKLSDYHGLPSDTNILNKALMQMNDDFSDILDLE